MKPMWLKLLKKAVCAQQINHRLLSYSRAVVVRQKTRQRQSGVTVRFSAERAEKTEEKKKNPKRRSVK